MLKCIARTLDFIAATYHFVFFHTANLTTVRLRFYNTHSVTSQNNSPHTKI